MKFTLVLFSIFAFIFASVQAADKSVCELPKQVGPCRKAAQAFYYNNEAKKCEQFIYGGCQGNENNFETKEECEKLCVHN